MPVWGEGDVHKFFETFEGYWPRAFREGDSKVRMETWLGVARNYEPQKAIGALRQLFLEQEIPRTPQPVAFRRAVGGGKTQETEAENTDTLQSVLPRLSPETRELYRARIAGRLDPEVSFHEFVDRALDGNPTGLSRSAITELERFRDRRASREVALVGNPVTHTRRRDDSIREPGEEG